MMNIWAFLVLSFIYYNGKNVDGPEINHPIYGQLDKGAKNIAQKKKKIPNQKTFSVLIIHQQVNG